MFKRGDIVRYSGGPISFIVLEENHNDRWYGTHCHGGIYSAYEYELSKPTEKELIFAKESLNKILDKNIELRGKYLKDSVDYVNKAIELKGLINEQ